MSNLKKLATAAVAVAAVSGAMGLKPAAATPATLGFYPATDIYGDKVFHFDADRYSTDDFGSKNGSTDTFGLTYGVGDKEGAIGRSEFGFDHFSNSGKSFGDSLLFNAKTQLYSNANQGVRAVGGLWLAGDTGNPAVSNTGYFLASKSFKFGRIHAGVAHAFSKKNLGADADTTYLQLGYDRAITPKILFAADFYSGRSPLSGVQPTLYYAVNDKASFGLGYFFNSEAKGASNTDALYLCFDYNFGGPKAVAGEPALGAPGASAGQ